MEIATLGGGCFWCLEAVYERLRGVVRVESGYAGGFTPDPTYEEVCSGTTGHAEVVQVHFEPQVIPFREIVGIFFAFHDPTTPNRQGADIGTQYRSIILCHSEEQWAVAEGVIAELNAAGLWGAPIVTELARFETFYPAEPEHRQYYRRNANRIYCRVVIDPKLAQLRTHFRDRLKTVLEPPEASPPGRSWSEPTPPGAGPDRSRSRQDR